MANSNSKIRPVFFSIKWKATLLVFVLFVIGVIILFRFIVNYQNDILEKRLQETMNVYLETFRKDVEVILIEKHDRAGLADILQSYQNITNFETAMFIDNAGNIIVSTGENSAGWKLGEVFNEFKKAYESKSYYTNYENKEKDIHWYYGFMPFYHPHLAKTDFKKIDEFIDLFYTGKLFKSENFTDEYRNDFLFIKDFEDTAGPYIEKQEKVGKARKKPLQDLLTVIDKKYLASWQAKFDSLKAGTDLIMTDRDFSELIAIMQKLGWSGKKTDEFIAMRKEKQKLFGGRIFNDAELKNDNLFINYVGNYLSNYIDSDNNFTKNFDNLVGKLTSIDYKQTVTQDHKKIEDSLINKDYFAASMKQLNADYKNLEKSRYTPGSITEEKIEKYFSDFKNIYRIGTVRIVLDLNHIKLDQVNINNDIINIAVMIILRLFALTYIFVSFIIRPLKVLSEGTDEIARGNLDRKIKVKARDEIGQLADKFNFMSASLKKAFEEVKDKARMEAELKNASDIQEAILPKSFPNTDKYIFSTYYKPQSESGGDYYDFIDVDYNHFGIVIADVTGHGVGAGIVMAMLRSHLRTYAAGEKDTSVILKGINPILKRDTLPNMFVTILYIVVDIGTGALYYTNAGHHPAIIYNSKDQNFKQLHTGGMPVGMVDSSIFNPEINLKQAQLKKGDFLIAFTDGIIEAKSASDEEYGEQRFFEAIKMFASDDLDRMRDNLVANLKNFTAGAEQSDDITLIIMKVV